MSSLKLLNQDAEHAKRFVALAMNINAAKGLQEVLKTNLGPKVSNCVQSVRVRTGWCQGTPTKGAAGLPPLRPDAERAARWLHLLASAVQQHARLVHVAANIIRPALIGR